MRLSLNFKLKAKHAQRIRMRHGHNWHSIDNVKKLQVEQQLTIVLRRGHRPISQEQLKNEKY